ncbi:MAG: hypothetical protein HC906_01660, partial [Bacteroidales bacterium]|nr:hypothetical protein [Bacteroidales bacterium]
FLGNIIKSQDLSIDWIRSYGGKSADNALSIALDNDNNVYVTGYFQGIAKFDKYDVNSFGDTDIFLTKIDKSGKLCWTKTFGSRFFRNLTITESGYDLTVDKHNNIYLTGSFRDTVIFDTQKLISHGFEDIFIAKFNTIGQQKWVKQIGGVHQELPKKYCCK